MPDLAAVIGRYLVSRENGEKSTAKFGTPDADVHFLISTKPGSVSLTYTIRCRQHGTEVKINNG
jgi:hypothetical protein